MYNQCPQVLSMAFPCPYWWLEQAPPVRSVFVHVTRSTDPQRSELSDDLGLDATRLNSGSGGRFGVGAPRQFVWIHPEDELSYVELACQLWVEWTGLKRYEVKGRARTTRKTVAESNPEVLGRVEHLCKAQENPAYPDQWDEIRDHTLRGFLGRQPGQSREIGIVLPELLFAPLMSVERKHGAWHWILIGEALAGAIAGSSLKQDERTAVLRRVREEVWAKRGDDGNPIHLVVERLAMLGAGPPQMGVRALTVLSRLALEPTVRNQIIQLLDTQPPMFRLFRAFTKLLQDESNRPSPPDGAEEPGNGEADARSSVGASDDEDRHAAQTAETEHIASMRRARNEFAIEVLGLTEPRGPYPARCLRLETLSTVCKGDRFDRPVVERALAALRKVVESPDATWRERTYAGEVITRVRPTDESLELCLKSWVSADRTTTTDVLPPLAHAAAVLVERQVTGQEQVKRAIGAKVTIRRHKSIRLHSDEVCAATISAGYDEQHWVLDAISQDEGLRRTVEHSIRVQAEMLTAPVYAGKSDQQKRAWKDHITGRVRFLCEEAVLCIAGSRRRQSLDCLSVAGLAGVASDVLLTAIVRPDADSEAMGYATPLWVQEIAAWAVGFLRQPDRKNKRLTALAEAARNHLEVAQSSQTDTDRDARVAAAHAALWAIGDAGGMRNAGYQATTPGEIVREVLDDALALPPEPHLAPARHAAAYSLRYCRPADTIAIDAESEPDPIVRSYVTMNLRWMRPPGE